MTPYEEKMILQTRIIFKCINNVFYSDDRKVPIEQIPFENIDETFLIAGLLALKRQYEVLTRSEPLDNFDFVGVVARLLHQHEQDLVVKDKVSPPSRKRPQEQPVTSPQSNKKTTEVNQFAL